MELSTPALHLYTRDLTTFSPTCPSDSAWYACPKSSPSAFVGCCSQDPCSSSNGCSQGNIRPVSFNASSHNTDAFPPDAGCGTGSNFFTCVSGSASDPAASRKTFWGCCKTNPCEQQTECPSGDLVPAFMSTDKQFEVYTGEKSEASPVASPTPVPSGDAGAGKSHTGVIVGGVVGGAVAIVAIVSLLIFFLCRRRRARSRAGTPEMAETGPGGEKSAAYTGSPTADEAPPTYSSPNPNMHPSSLSPIPGHKYHQADQRVHELPVELPSSSTQRYSELPADSQTSKIAELESPMTSPQQGQGTFGGENGAPGTPEAMSPMMSPNTERAMFGRKL
ncbi:hypothetical protein K458DRAFT_386249 [Lentithecium fluviatile CBS 122367]|uniref:Mid2 domain-containing protein n=1 Tax=Lentithecium fluviatile CBS 122367 TaxID=1168545 RepID=A0A6G1JBB2_9PLEO|nr:hypothetical protein K458DRAFT_386249 [Lentithecium fluviatile CBS 122367]